MANTCSHILIIQGIKEERDKFISLALNADKIKGYTLLDMDALCPLEDGDEDTQHREIEQWGTAWAVLTRDIAEEDDKAYIALRSNWSPCDKWVKKIAPDFPELMFELSASVVMGYPDMDCDYLKVKGDDILEETHTLETVDEDGDVIKVYDKTTGESRDVVVDPEVKKQHQIQNKLAHEKWQAELEERATQEPDEEVDNDKEKDEIWW